MERVNSISQVHCSDNSAIFDTFRIRDLRNTVVTKRSFSCLLLFLSVKLALCCKSSRGNDIEYLSFVLNISAIFIPPMKNFKWLYVNDSTVLRMFLHYLLRIYLFSVLNMQFYGYSCGWFDSWRNLKWLMVDVTLAISSEWLFKEMPICWDQTFVFFVKSAVGFCKQNDFWYSVWLFIDPAMF